LCVCVCVCVCVCMSRGQVSPPTLRVWCRILERVADSRLLIKLRMFDISEVEKHTAALARTLAPHDEELQADLVSRKRIIFLPRAGSEAEHLQCYARLDIALDTFPYSGTTTTVDALLMGVPVVTRRLEGSKSVHAANVSASILSQAGLSELVAADEDGFVDIAVSLATAGGGEKIRKLRADMRARMLASPLCDAAGFVTKLEAAYRDMWRVFCSEAAA